MEPIADAPSTRRGIRGAERALGALLCLAAVILAAVGPSGLLRARLENGEGRALRAMLMIAASQESWRAHAHVDQDLDTLGEYGLLGELAGRLPPRGALPGVGPVRPAFLPEAFGTKGRDGDGCAVVGGYVFRVFLAEAVEADGQLVVGDDRALGGTEQAPGPSITDDLALDESQEKGYVLYAWPRRAGWTGRRAFVVTQGPLIFETDMDARRYSGRGPLGAPNVPAADAAFPGPAFQVDPETGEGLPPRLPDEAFVGADGNTWRPARLARRTGPLP